jgi:hypothetical protein
MKGIINTKWDSGWCIQVCGVLGLCDVRLGVRYGDCIYYFIGVYHVLLMSSVWFWGRSLVTSLCMLLVLGFHEGASRGIQHLYDECTLHKVHKLGTQTQKSVK